MTDLNSQEVQFLIGKAHTAKKVNNILSAFCSLANGVLLCFTAAESSGHTLTSKVLFWTCVALTVVFVGIVAADIYMMVKYQTKVRPLVARWIAETTEASTLLPFGAKAEFSMRMEGDIVYLKRAGSAEELSFDASPLGTVFTARGVAELIKKYLKARLYALTQSGNTLPEVSCTDSTNKRIKQEYFALNGELIKNDGAKNPFVKYGIVNI